MIAREVKFSVALAQHSRFVGELAWAQCERLSSELPLIDEPAPLQVDLRVDDQRGWPSILGHVRAQIKMACQRCDVALLYPLDTQLDLRVVRSDDEERAALSSSDPYWVQDDRLPLWELIEDEVLLALPMLMRCETCENAVLSAPASQPEPAEAPRVNPFAALKQQFKPR